MRHWHRSAAVLRAAVRTGRRSVGCRCTSRPTRQLTMSGTTTTSSAAAQGVDQDTIAAADLHQLGASGPAIDARGKPITEDELQQMLFEFDLNGYVVVRGALSPGEVAECNAAIDQHEQEFHERTDPELRNTKAGTPLSGDGKTGRMDLSGMLGWPEPQCTPFRRLLAHPSLVPVLHRLVGKGYRMDHIPFLIAQNKGSEGFKLHGGPLTSQGGFNPHLQYVCKQGQIYNSLLAMSVVLTPHSEGSGGFCVVRGSHKLNFGVPDAMMHGEAMQEHVYQPVTQPGDVVFFSEATVHGALPWTAEHQRRVVLYRFAPPNCAYGRSYYPTWPEAFTRGCTPEQLAVLEPPYNNRLDRPYIADSGEIESQTRADVKKQFDAEVFGTKYF